jgi:hypothetical protein
MPFDTKALKRALGGIVGPQFFNKTNDEYEVVEGSDGAIHTKLTGSNAVNIKDSNGTSVFASSAVGDNNPGGFLAAGQYGFNGGTTWDRWRNNTEGTLLASAARTANGLSPNQTNYNARGVILHFNCTAAGATGGITLLFGYIDPVSGTRYEITGPKLTTTTGFRTMVIYPSATTGATNNINFAVPRAWFAIVRPDDGASYTYSVGYSLIL